MSDPEIAALARCFAHNDGIAVLPDTIQYLNERAADETNWLQALSTSDVDTTLVWGLHDNVAPVRVANYVWQEFSGDKPGLKPLLDTAELPITTCSATLRPSWPTSCDSPRPPSPRR